MAETTRGNEMDKDRESRINAAAAGIPQILLKEYDKEQSELLAKMLHSAAMWPEDFRASDWIIRLEQEGFDEERAKRIVRMVMRDIVMLYM